MRHQGFCISMPDAVAPGYKYPLPFALFPACASLCRLCSSDSLFKISVHFGDSYESICHQAFDPVLFMQ